MAMGKRDIEQASLWVATSDLPVSPGHPFYTRLNGLLEAHDFDRFVEDLCRPFYAPVMRAAAHRELNTWRRRPTAWATLCGAPAFEATLERLIEQAGVPVITPHGLRHACATTLLRAGIPAHAVSRRLGHANPSITLKTYAHALPEDDRDAADIMGAVLGGNTAEAHNSRAIQASQTGTK